MVLFAPHSIRCLGDASMVLFAPHCILCLGDASLSRGVRRPVPHSERRSFTPPSNERTRRRRFRKGQEKTNGQQRCRTGDRTPRQRRNFAQRPAKWSAKGAPPRKPFSLPAPDDCAAKKLHETQA